MRLADGLKVKGLFSFHEFAPKKLGPPLSINIEIKLQIYILFSILKNIIN
jgi:hypothetical protein